MRRGEAAAQPPPSCRLSARDDNRTMGRAARGKAFGLQIAGIQFFIDEYLNSELSSASDGIKAIVTGAFQLNQNRYDAKRLLELKTYDIDDDRWRRAMEIIDDSVTTTLTCRCISFYEKKGEQWFTKNLNFSTIHDKDALPGTEV